MNRNELDAVRHYVRRYYSYEGFADPVEAVSIEMVEQDGHGNEHARAGDYWITDGTYGELVRVRGAAVEQIAYEGA